MTRRRAEAALALLLAAALMLVGGAVLFFVFTISPVHTNPAAVPSTPAAAQSERYSDAVEETRGLARSLLVEENLPGLSVAAAPLNHPNWRNGVRIGPWAEDRVTGFIPPFERKDRNGQGVAGEGVAVDADGNVFAAEGPNSFVQAGGAFTKYSK